MNILKPELIWVNGLCYRFLDNSEGRSSHNISPYIEDENQFGCIDYDEESSTDIEIVPFDTKYKHTFKVPKSFFPFIIGAKNAVRKRLETESKTTIQIPRLGEDGDIAIIGYDHQGIRTARRRINLIIESSRKRLNTTHFLSIPLNEGCIIMEFRKFKMNVIANFQERAVVSDKLFQIPSKLHITIGLLTLLDDIERNQAVEALNYCKEHIVKQIIKKHGHIRIRLQGLEIMNDDPREAKVLYAKIVPNEALQNMVDEIMNYFAYIGFLHKEKDSVKLHVTFMNTKFTSRDEEVDTKTVKTFDATEILEAFKETSFGETLLEEIHISQRHTTGPDGYYQKTAKINLLKDL
ncbi:activating signal cointegrator 1 complex subunit 1 [Calliopsis andreniformis]|uniref:activating signal cointegrator 1 complex subunit 1 n=1 Tax=Calliopsis andreniformis TaxID=337506 RepID=UPI003FCC7E71